MGEQGGCGGQVGGAAGEGGSGLGDAGFTDSWEIVKGNLIPLSRSRPQNSFAKCRVCI